MPFWNANPFDLNDPINNEIWGGSPALQREIHLPGAIRVAGAFGAQQAMLTPGIVPGVGPETILPWVPDLAGKKWKEKASVFVVGSAYAGFIKEYSGRPATMNLCCYASANSSRMFQERFLKDVVEPDEAYYGKLAILFQNIRRASQLCLLDLCRASFVKRGERPPFDVASETTVLQPAWTSYRQYVEANDAWTWRRLNPLRKQPIRIVALGYVAENGILQLIRRQLAGEHLEIHDSVGHALQQGWWNNAWNYGYADVGRPLHYWFHNHRWWIIRSKDCEWRVLPIYHPAYVNQHDPNYFSTREVLKQFLNAP